MKRWAILVVFLYGAMLFVVAGPVMFAAFWPGSEAGELLKMHVTFDTQLWPLWAWIGVMMLAEAALLVVPVRVADDQPIRRRHVFWTVLATVFALLVMIAGMTLAFVEHVQNTPGATDRAPAVLFGGVGALWLFWTILFAFHPGAGVPRSLASRLVRSLLAGSILELLVAVPTHIIARWRNYCCAGYLTFWGLATGTTVLLLAFGPGVFFLFARRWRALKSRRPHRSEATSSSRTE